MKSDTMKRRDTRVQAKIDEIEKRRLKVGVSKGALSEAAELNADYWSHLTSATGTTNPGGLSLMKIEEALCALEVEKLNSSTSEPVTNDATEGEALK